MLQKRVGCSLTLLVLIVGILPHFGHAESVDPKAMWYDGLDRIAGKFQFVQISSPGGLWEETITGGNKAMRQVSLNEIPTPLRDKLKNSEISVSVLGSSLITSADQTKSPGQRGQPPYHGHLRRYESSGNGQLTIHGLPGIALSDGDSGEFSGAVNFVLNAANHSDPSDVGIMNERLQQEMTWGAAAQSRNYADFEAHRQGSSPDDPTGTVMANARLLRGGREIISFIEWQDPTPPPGASSRRYFGSVRLIRL